MGLTLTPEKQRWHTKWTYSSQGKPADTEIPRPHALSLHYDLGSLLLSKDRVINIPQMLAEVQQTLAGVRALEDPMQSSAHLN